MEIVFGVHKGCKYSVLRFLETLRCISINIVLDVFLFHLLSSNRAYASNKKRGAENKSVKHENESVDSKQM